jgi:ubiquinone biosynthesis protein
LTGYVKTIPKYVNDVLRAAAGGKQRIELMHGGFEALNSQLEKGVNRLTLGVIIAASIIAAALVLNASEKVLELTLPFLGLQKISLTALFGLTGYIIATILGIWLIVSILRSGKL